MPGRGRDERRRGDMRSIDIERRSGGLLSSPDRLAVRGIPPLVSSDVRSHLRVLGQLEGILGVFDIDEDETHAVG